MRVSSPQRLKTSPGHSDDRYQRARRWFPWLFTLIALEGAAATAVLASLPSDAGAYAGAVAGGIFLNFSSGRLLLLGLMAGLSGGFALLAWLSRRSPAQPWLDPARRPRLWATLFLLLPLLVIASLLLPLILFSLYWNSQEFYYLAYYQRLLPLCIWLALAGLELLVGIAWLGRFHWQALRAQQGVFRAGLVAWAAFGLLGLFVIITGTGLRADVIGWGLPAVALLEWQVWLAWAAGTAFFLFLASRRHQLRNDFWIAVAIWLLAAGLWLSQPVRPAFFATAGRAPNHEIYPFSDGAYYGTFAQSLLIGNGFKGEEIPPRPLYITLLAGFHALGGQRYENIIALQTLFLAFFSVILYFLGKELHSRPAGLVIALLAILREVTAVIAVPYIDNASNSKLFFADLPSALAISLWVLLAVRWLKAPRARPLYPLLVGGVLGLAMLFRTQTVFLLPALLLFALFAIRAAPGPQSHGKKKQHDQPHAGAWGFWLRSTALLLLGLALAVAPWLWRNWENKGQLVFDDSKSQTGSMAARYSLSGNDLSYVIQPGEDEREYSARVTRGIYTFLTTHPGIVAEFVAAHFFNAEIANALILPVRSGIATVNDLVMPDTAFWETWKGYFSPAQLALFALHLGLIALGVGACWARLGWAGLVPLASNFSYNFSMSLARNSGGRYLLAVDWITYVYAAVGLLEISIALLSIVGLSPKRIAPLLASRDAKERQPHRTAKPSWWKGAQIGLALLFLGALPVLVELLVPPRYPVQSREQLVREVTGSAQFSHAGSSAVSPAALEQFAAQPGVLILRGRALYPRFYGAGEGEPRTAKTGYEPLDFARTVFQLVSADFNGLAMLKSAAEPSFFPNASDVVVIGCRSGSYVEPAVVLVEGSPGFVYTADAGLPRDCPEVSSEKN